MNINTIRTNTKKKLDGGINIYIELIWESMEIATGKPTGEGEAGIYSNALVAEIRLLI